MQKVILTALLFCSQAAMGADIDPAAVDFFEKKIRPVLVQHCYECHSVEAKQLRAGLRVDTRELIRQGGESGPAVVPGKIDESLLITALRYESFEMPPTGRLPDEVITDFVKWVEMGAPDPRDGREVDAGTKRVIDIEAGRQFWAFQPPVRAAVPRPADASWPRGDIDRFLRAKQEESGLVPGRDAERRTLIRRAYFDLIGLPPSPEGIAEFLNDDSADAWENLIDRLLRSPQFGERWGRHWLDVARYSDSTGGGRSMLYGQAWRYRDYVIGAFNADKPFDRFILEQVAGDLLPRESYVQAQSQIIATAFLALGPTNYEEQDKEQLRMDVVDEQIDTVGRAFMGMTIGCARCHDHKFDPIPTADYYALAGIFRSTQTLIHDNVSTWIKTPLPLEPEMQQRLTAHEQALSEVQSQIAALQTRLQTLRGQLPIVTVDDEQVQEFKGTWRQSSGVKEFVGEGYRYASGAGAEVTYRVPLRHAGRYEVRVSYTAHENRSPNALVKVRHAGGEAEARIDQRAKPPIDDLYLAVGQYEFAAGEQVVTVSTEGTSGAVVADAVQCVPLFRVEASAAPTMHIVQDLSTLPGIVVDNTAAELTGAWKDSVYTKSFVGGGYIHDDREGRGAKSVTFRAELPQSGEYEVRLSYTTGDSRATRVPVRITLPGREETVYVNQRQEPDVDGLFTRLGRFEFNNDQTAVVTVSNEGTDDGYVIADAVQFVPADLAAPTKSPVSTGALAGSPNDDDDAMDLLAELSASESQLSTLNSQLSNLKSSAPIKPSEVVSVKDEGTERGDYQICIRGSVKNLGDVVPRGFLTVATTGKTPTIPAAVSGRLELAQWIASPENPLTARVAVNRVWSHLFGTGLVRTVDNFGSTGETPSHPELLDFLALRFVDGGWSVKGLIREIMLSRTYRLACDAAAEHTAADPENRLLAHQNRRRLDAEAIYDSILSLSGALDLATGGDTIRPDTKSEYNYRFDVGRRAVYLPVFRNQLPDLFAVFDFPDPNLSQGRRTTSTLSTQALFLMNSPFAGEQSRRAAERLLADETDTAGRLDLLYERALGRLPDDTERRLALEYLEGADSAGQRQRLERWTGLCQGVIGCLDFRYTE
jgi:hypothetical protein